MLNKVETYFMKEFKEKAGILVALSLLLLVPQHPWRLFFLFLLITTLLPSDVHHKRKIKLLMSLPFSRTEIFWISYIFLITIAVITQMIGGAFFNVVPHIMGLYIIRTLIFSSAYFGMAMISVTFGFGNFGVPFLVLIADSFFGSIRSWNFTYNFLGSPDGSNPYSMISPIYQGNQIASSAFAAALLITAYILFKKGETSR